MISKIIDTLLNLPYKILCVGENCKNKFIKPFYFIVGTICLLFVLLIIPFLCVNIIGLVMFYLIFCCQNMPYIIRIGIICFFIYILTFILVNNEKP